MLATFPIQLFKVLQMRIERAKLEILSKGHLANGRRVHVLLGLQQRKVIRASSGNADSDANAWSHGLRETRDVRNRRAVVVRTNWAQAGDLRKFAINLVLDDPSPGPAADIQQLETSLVRQRGARGIRKRRAHYKAARPVAIKQAGDNIQVHSVSVSDRNG